MEKLKIFKRIGATIVCLFLAGAFIVGFTGCTKENYKLAYIGEVPIYNDNILVGYTVTAKIKINEEKNGLIYIPTSKLLFQEYAMFPTEGSVYPTKDYLVYYYGKVYRMEINLNDRSYPIKDRYVSYDESPDYCTIPFYSNLPKEFELTIFYLLDESLTKKLDLSTYEYVKAL